jgi:hypothetical protein
MSPDPDNDAPFAYGDGTVMQLRSQSFHLPDDFGTMMVSEPSASSAGSDIALPIALPAAAQDDDALVRMEQKLDLALRQLERLQQRIESLDLTMARVLNR